MLIIEHVIIVQKKILNLPPTNAYIVHVHTALIHTGLLQLPTWTNPIEDLIAS